MRWFRVGSGVRRGGWIGFGVGGVGDGGGCWLVSDVRARQSTADHRRGRRVALSGPGMGGNIGSVGLGCGSRDHRDGIRRVIGVRLTTGRGDLAFGAQVGCCWRRGSCRCPDRLRQGWPGDGGLDWFVGWLVQDSCGMRGAGTARSGRCGRADGAGGCDRAVPVDAERQHPFCRSSAGLVMKPPCQ